MSNKTYVQKPKDVHRHWHLVDAENEILGRLATRVAALLAGKNKRTFTPHVDGGDVVVIVNAAKVRITGNNKPVQKTHFSHSGFLGGEKITPYSRFLKTHPERAVELAVSGMLPKNRLRDRRMARLKVYRGDAHPHGAQFAVRKTAEPAPAS